MTPIFILPFLFLTQSAPQMRLDYRSAPIDDVIYRFTKETGVIIIKEPSLKTKLTIMSDKPLSHKDAFSALFSALRASNIDWHMESGFLILTQKQTKVLDTSINPELLVKGYKLNYLNSQSLSIALNSLYQNVNFRASYEHYSNVLIVNANEEKHIQISEILKKIDLDIKPKYTSTVFKLNYASTSDVSKILSNVLSKLDKNYDPSSLIEDYSTNSLIVYSPSDRVDELKTLVKVLDVKVESRDSVFIQNIKNANAEDLATILRQLAGGTP